MSRWMIEKSGTGIEKSGTGIEKSGTGIEKSGTGIEKSGTGIEKSGTGIHRALMSLVFAAVIFSSGIQANAPDPAGSLTLVIENEKVAVSWIVDGSVFSGVSQLQGSFSSLVLTEVALSTESTDIAGSGTGGELDIAGSGTGGELDIAGSGTGGELDIAGSGTGGELDIAGSGTGGELDIAGSGTGGSIEIAGSGTGGSDSIIITLPEGTGLAMEINVGCGVASVSVLDADFAEVVSFYDVPVIGGSDFCGK